MPRIIKIPHVFIDILSKIVFNITVPCAIFYAFVTSEFNPSLIMLVGVGFLCCFIPWFVAMLITWREDRDHKVFMMCNISGYNIGNFVLPFAMTMFPSHTIVAICLFDAGNALMTNGGIYPFTSALVEKGTSLAGEFYWLCSAFYKVCSVRSLCVIGNSCCSGSANSRTGSYVYSANCGGKFVSCHVAFGLDGQFFY